MNYTSINLNKLCRVGLFQFYIDKMRIVMSLTEFPLRYMAKPDPMLSMLE